MRSICDLRREILKLAAVDALPYARALRAVDDALAVFDLVQGATGGEVRARGRGPWGSALYLLSDGRVSCSAHADDDGRVVGDGPFDDRKLARHALARIVDDIRGRLADEVAERIDWWVVDGAEQMVQAGLLDKVQAALVYAGASR